MPPSQHAWAENTRIRTEGSRNLVDAALAAGASVYVQESIAFLYGDHGDELIDAASTPIVDNRFSEPVRAAEAEAKRFAESGGRGVVLRFGLFLAPDSEQMLTMARDRAPRASRCIPATANGFFPSIHADDAAAAVVAALDGAERHVRRRRRRATAPRRAARGAGARRSGAAPARADPHARRRSSGRSAIRSGVSNRALPRRYVVDTAGSRACARRGRQTVTGGRHRTRVVGVGAPAPVVHGDRQVSASGSRPCSRRGRSTTTSRSAGVGSSMDGPYNQHLVRDVGSLNLALVVLVLAALFVSTRTLARIAAVVYLVNAVPHFVYHLAAYQHGGTWRARTRSGSSSRSAARSSCSLAGWCCVTAASPEAYGCDVKVAAVQHDIVWEDRDANFAATRADDRTAAAARRRAARSC